jgi:hypothetical protein
MGISMVKECKNKYIYLKKVIFIKKKKKKKKKN